MALVLPLAILLLVQGSATAVRLSVATSRIAPSPTRRPGAPIMQAQVPADERVAVVLLAGGSGSRMKVSSARCRSVAYTTVVMVWLDSQANMPKQFLELNGRPVLEHSLELLSKVQQVRPHRVEALFRLRFMGHISP